MEPGISNTGYTNPNTRTSQFNEIAVSSLVGAVILLAIAISAFGVIYFNSMNAVTSYFNEFPPNAHLLGSIPQGQDSHLDNSSTIFLQHEGGEELINWELLVNGEPVENGTNFGIGETIKIDLNITRDSIIQLSGNDDNGNQGIVYNYYYEVQQGPETDQDPDPPIEDPIPDPDPDQNETPPSSENLQECNSWGCLLYNNSNLTFWYENKFDLNPIFFWYYDPDIPKDLQYDIRHSYKLPETPTNNSRIRLQVTYSDNSLADFLFLTYP